MSAIKKQYHVLLSYGYRTELFYKGVGQFAREHHWILYPNYTVGNDPLGDYDRLDGVLMVNNTPDFIDTVKEKYGDIPVVGMCYTDRFPTVIPDNKAVGKMAARYFLNKKYLHYLCVYRFHSKFSLSRKDGFFEELLKVKHDIESLDHLQIFDTNKKGPNYREKLRNALSKCPKPLAVFTDSDYASFLLINEAFYMGLKVPEDIIVLGVDDEAFYNYISPVSLSTIDNNKPAISYTAAEMLQQLMEKRQLKEKRRYIPPLRVIERQSTDIAQGGSNLFKKAIDYITDHFSEPISAEDITIELNVSRSVLYKLFKEKANTSVAREISRIRFEQAKQLRKEKHLPLSSIAEKCGFSNDKHLRRTFKRFTGLSPRDWLTAFG